MNEQIKYIVRCFARKGDSNPLKEFMEPFLLFTPEKTNEINQRVPALVEAMIKNKKAFQLKI